MYDWLDGDKISPYRCRKLSDLKEGIKQYVHRAYEDADVKSELMKIRGHLVDWPMNFLADESLEPSLALSIVSGQLLS